jgi:hypothetical protein
MRVLTVVVAMVVCGMLAGCGDPNYTPVVEPVVTEPVAPVEPVVPVVPNHGGLNISMPSGSVTVTIVYPAGESNNQVVFKNSSSVSN